MMKKKLFRKREKKIYNFKIELRIDAHDNV